MRLWALKAKEPLVRCSIHSAWCSLRLSKATTGAGGNLITMLKSLKKLGKFPGGLRDEEKLSRMQCKVTVY